MKDFRILLVEDERQMATFIEMELVHEGYVVDIAYDGRKALEMFTAESYDLVLLDVMIPELNGIEVCRRIRQTSKVPVIMLTAKSDVPDKVLGLDTGANDYMTKPFAIEELLARIRVYKRDKEEVGEEIRLKDVVLNSSTHQVWRGEREIELTKKEFDILKMLLVNRNIVLSREQFIEEVWGYDYMGDTNVVDVFIRYLRTKLEEGFSEKLISTIRGVGYVIKDR